TICRLGERRSLRCVTWSALANAPSDPKAPWDVLVVDEFGWLPSVYAYAELVFLGGTVAPIGGHNILEPALLERPIIVVPHIGSIAALVGAMKIAGGVVQLSSDPPVDALVEAAVPLLENRDRAQMIGRAAREVCAGFSGAAERYCVAIARQLA